MELNLQAKTKEQQRIKAYLEENASEILAEKINNGVRIQKDGKMLLNKKTLDGFMKFACDKAKKQAEKGAPAPVSKMTSYLAGLSITLRRTPSKGLCTVKTARNTIPKKSFVNPLPRPFPVRQKRKRRRCHSSKCSTPALHPKDEKTLPFPQPPNRTLPKKTKNRPKRNVGKFLQRSQRKKNGNSPMTVNIV